MGQTKVISIANLKGGVGKTTSAINIGAALNKRDKKVLLIDLDPQSNLSQSFGLFNHKTNIFEGLRQGTLEPINIFEGLDVVPSSFDLSSAEIELISQSEREFFIKDLINEVKDSYDFIIIDCPPSLNLLTINAFTASDEIIIPLQAEFSVKQEVALRKLEKVYGWVKQGLNKELDIAGFFITQYDDRKSLNVAWSMIAANFNSEIFSTKIRDDVALAEASIETLDIFRYSAKSRGAEDYLALSNEIIKKLFGEEKKEVRATFVVNEESLDKIKSIAYWERGLIKDIVNEALRNYITKYEKKKGMIKSMSKI